MTDNENRPGIDELTPAALHDLIQSRASISLLDAPSLNGVYAIYLRSPEALEPFIEGRDGLIYIGLSTNLAEREFEQHFATGNTGFSTLRRSIGALLKTGLKLRAIPRSDGPSETNVRNYRFTPKGEDRLTDWMQGNLEVGVHASIHYDQLEDALVGSLKPLLNLTKWPNPQRKEIKRLRKVCADEARAFRGS
jgi:GIY-YIG catalytic domain